MPANDTPRTVVDSHAHVFVQGMPLAATRRHAPQFDAPLDLYMDLLDAHGISHGVLVQPSFLGTDNSFMLNAMARHPQRLRSVVVLDPTTDEQALNLMDALGVVGVRLNLMGLPLPDLREPVWQKFLSHLRVLDWHLELHRQASDLPALIDAALPAGCRIVIDHFGRPAADQGSADPGFADLLRRADSGKVWVKLSAAYRNTTSALTSAAQRTPQMLDADAERACACAHELLAAFGPQRLVWGSDWPHTQHTELVDYTRSQAVLSEWVPNAADRAQILGDTAADLFHIAE
jgi:predicted TIM-barrel fold metal-dependent hydrolase